MGIERQKQSEQDVQPLIDKMRNKGKYSDEIIQLVKEDLMLGFNKAETDQYVNRKYDIRQMRIYSECMRNDYPQEAIKVICADHLDANQMTVLLDMYRSDIPLEKIKTIMEEAEGVPKRMNVAFEKMKEEIQKTNMALTEKVEVVSNIEANETVAQDNTCENTELLTQSQKGYVAQLVSELKEVADKINYQESRYDELNQKLKMFEASKEDQAVMQGLVDELAEKEKMLDTQQDELSKANSALARLRNEKEQSEIKLKKEKNGLQDEVDDLKRKLKNKVLEMQNIESGISRICPQKESITEGEDKMQYKPKEYAESLITTIPQTQLQGSRIPVYYQVPVVDIRGQAIQMVPLEGMQRKSNGIVGILGKLGFKKKSRVDIVKLVASGNLVPAQLVQIKSAIESGLTEGQLIEIINNNVAAEKMKEIIEIAVLENSMA